MSPAALIESAALDAARSTSQAETSGDWAVVSLTMVSGFRPAASSAESARVQSIRMDGAGRMAMIEVGLVDGDGNIATRGDVVCLLRDDAVEAPTDAIESPRRPHA
jgi:hypothetical protein